MAEVENLVPIGCCIGNVKERLDNRNDILFKEPNEKRIKMLYSLLSFTFASCYI
jgi:hypothetical protein